MASHALKQSSSTERRATLYILIAVTIVAVICAFGPLWMVRVGLGVALLGAATSVWYAFKEINRLEVLHRTELKAVRDQAVLAARAHHDESMELIETFTSRYKAHGQQLSALRGELASRQQELSTLRGNVISATAEADRRGERITELEAQLAERQAELEALEVKLTELAAEHDGELVTLPRRVVSRKAADAARAVPTAAELWSDGNHPTVVDLALLNIPAMERKHA